MDERFPVTPAAELPPPPADFDVTPEDLLAVLGKLAARWPGQRQAGAPFLSGVKVGGSRMPIVWISQNHFEFSKLAGGLPEDQPVYGLKSVYLGGEGFSDAYLPAMLGQRYVGAVSAAYLADVQAVLGDRPYVLGGNCTGAVTALDMALRAARAPRTLILMNLFRPARPYAGPCKLLFGSKEWADFQNLSPGPEVFSQADLTMLGGTHGTYFSGEGFATLVGTLTAATD